MTRIVKFAVATAMRLDEICRVEWTDLDGDRRMLMIRDRKDPRNKTGNDQRIPLFGATGFDAWALVTGHKDWKMLRRYTHIRPETLHRLAASLAPSPLATRAAE